MVWLPADSAGARPILMTFLEEIKKQLNDVTVTLTGFIGAGRLEPMVELHLPIKDKVTYVKMTLKG